MGDLKEEICREQLEWVRRRLEALDKIEAKLRQMRELAIYAASRTLTNEEASQVQEWINILQAEVNEIDKATKKSQQDSIAH
ncbi:MAG: hypothetical protein ACOYD5_09070 [Negativicutes bacterium]